MLLVVAQHKTWEDGKEFLVNSGFLFWNYLVASLSSDGELVLLTFL
jgi:hypothetical protein